MKKLLTPFALFLFLSLSLSAQYTWRTKACFPTSRAGGANFSIGTKAYYVGGSNTTGTIFGEVYEYDETTNTWTQKNNFPGVRSAPSSFVINDTAYVGLGYDGSSYHTDFYMYDQANDSWISIAAFPGSARYTAMSMTVNGNGYIGCGKGGGQNNDFYQYNPSSNTWTKEANFPGSARQNGIAAGIGNYGYMGLGYNGSYFTDFYQYNPNTNTWVTMATFPGTARFAANHFVIQSALYVAGGTASAGYLTDTWKFDTTTFTWTQLAGFSCVSPPCNNWGGFAINDHGYLPTSQQASNPNGSTNFNEHLLEFSQGDLSFVTNNGVLGNDTSYCGSFSRVLSTGNSCTQWSTGVTGSQITVTIPGTYWEITADSCGMVGDTIVISAGSVGSVTIRASGSPSFCLGDSVILDAGAGYNTYLWSTNATSETITVKQTGNYSCTVTQGGCQGVSDTVAVSVSNNPTPVIRASGATTFCKGDSVILDAGAGYSGYSWNDGETTETITVKQNGNYSVNVTSGSCQGGSDTITVTVNNNPAPIIRASGSTAFCQGDSVVLDAGAGYSGYSWNDGETTETITVKQNGGFSVIVTLNGCTGGSDTVTVTENNNPTPIITANGSKTFCQGDSVILDAGAGYSNYSWNDGETTETITVKQNGGYSATVTQNGCTGSSDTVTVTANNSPTPVITANGSKTFCQGDSVILDAGAGYSNYSWNDGETTETITVKQNGGFSATVTQNGCTGGSDTVTVTENNNPTPIITANGSKTFCQGDSVILDAGAGYSSYSWNDGETTETITVKQNGGYSATVTQNGCTGGSDTVNVTVSKNPAPVITANGATTFCQGDSVKLDAGAGYSSYSWNDGETTETITVKQNGSFSCTVTLNGCTGGSDTVTVSITLTPPNAVCKGITVTLDSVNGEATITASQVDGGSTAVCGIASETISQSTFTIIDTGINTVVLTVTDNSGHTSTCDAAVTIKAPATTNNCEGFSCSVTSVPTSNCEETGGNPEIIYIGYGPQATRLCVSASGKGPFSYSWSPKTNLSCSNCSNPLFEPTTAGLYTFDVTVTNSSGCTSTCTITICVQDIRVPAQSCGGFGFGNSFCGQGGFNGCGGYQNGQVYLCHYPPGNHSNPQTLCISVNGVGGHIPCHPGDHLGSCGQDCNSGNHKDEEIAQLIPGNENGFDLIIYPNPFVNEFHVTVETQATDQINMKIYNITGQLISESNSVEPNSAITLGSELQRGVYLVEITQGQSRQVIRMVKAE